MWVEFARNTLPCTSTGFSPFQCVFGYQPPLFPAREEEVRVPSAHNLVRRCRRTTEPFKGIWCSQEVCGQKKKTCTEVQGGAEGLAVHKTLTPPN